MGLLDRLLDRMIDETIASRRDTTNRRRALQDEAVALLTGYSESVETMRIALLHIRDLVERRSVLDLQSVGDLQFGEIASPRDGAGGVVRGVLDLGVTEGDATMLAEQFAAQAWNEVFGERRSHRLESARDMGDRLLAAATEAEALDRAWARVRPILDDALEIEVVVYLREFRHELRSMLSYTLESLHAYAAAGPGTADVARESLRRIDDLLAFADGWHAQVGGVRRDLRDAR